MEDRAYLGLVRYGSKHLTGWNLLRFVTTKRMQYAEEREVRAFLWIGDPIAGMNRHIDGENRIHPLPLTPPPDRVLKGHRRKVDLQALITEIMITPWASPETFDEVNALVRSSGCTIPVQPSKLSRYRDLLPYRPPGMPQEISRGDQRDAKST